MRINEFPDNKQSEKGYSIVELIVVVVIISILTAMALISFRSKTLYAADSQATQLTDVFQEARQRALSQRRTMRVEINNTDKVISLINENNPGDATDDRLLKSVPFGADGVVFGTVPTNMSTAPVELTPIPVATFKSSQHPLSLNEQVMTFRFLRNGTVTDAGTSATGTSANVTGGTIYVWSKKAGDYSPTSTTGDIFRAVTVTGTTGSTRLWKCKVTSGQCSSWIN